MVATLYILFFVLAVVAVTYPEEFPKLVRNPEQLINVIGMETRRRWLLLKFGTILFYERLTLQYSLWINRDIIESERLKQQQKETNND